MGQSATSAALKGALIKLRKEGYASGMVLRSHYAAAKDAQIKLSKEVCA